MTTPMLPELSAGLDTSIATAAWAMTAYMIPFAGLLLVSGTLGERWGRARSIRVAYIAYAVASVLCALAPSAPLFLAARAAQGAANAFTSPLLVASISDTVRPADLGRALGRFASLQAAGQAFAPLIGGAAAALDYRWAFLASALAAGGLALLPPQDAPREAGAPRPRWRALANRRLAVSCTVAFCLYLATSGLQLLVALRSDDRFGLGPDARGLVVAAFGAAGLATGARLGRAADRLGVRVFGLAALTGFAVAVLLAGVVPALWLLVALVAVAGAASTASRVVVNALAIRSTPANRGGAMSMTLAWQFLGSALAPLLVLPLYAGAAPLGPAVAFAVAAAVAVPAAVVLGITGGGRGPDRTAPVRPAAGHPERPPTG
jgi:MFS transporter, ACDE family, multidrug resistance protein